MVGTTGGFCATLYQCELARPAVPRSSAAVKAAALKGVDPSPASFDVDTLRKDLRTMLAEGKRRGYELPVVERVAAIYDEASQAGWGQRDGNAQPRYWSTRKPA